MATETFWLVCVPDVEDDELFIYDTGTKEAMSKAFENVVINGAEEGNFYLIRVLKSAEVVNGADLDVTDHGDEE